MGGGIMRDTLNYISLNDDMNHSFAVRFKEAKEKSGLTYSEIAKQIGVTQQALNRYAQGQSLPTFDNAVKLSLVLGVSLDWLAYGVQTANNDPTIYDIVSAIYTIKNGDPQAEIQVSEACDNDVDTKYEKNRKAINITIHEPKTVYSYQMIENYKNIMEDTAMNPNLQSKEAIIKDIQAIIDRLIDEMKSAKPLKMVTIAQ